MPLQGSENSGGRHATGASPAAEVIRTGAAGTWRAAQFGSRTAAASSHHEVWFVAAVISIWLLARIWYSLAPLWFDELFTFYLARLHFEQLLRAIPADGNPPLYHLLARASMAAFGQTELAVRLPAIAGFLGAALAVYHYIRRRRPAVFALLGMLVLLCSPVADYGSEARPYSLMLAFTGLALVSWQAACEERRSRVLPLIGVAAGIAGAIATHHYGSVYVGITILSGEAVRIIQRRKLDIPLYCAAAAGLCMLAFTVPLAIASHRVMFDFVRESPVFWSRPSLRKLFSYRWMMSVWFPPAFLALLQWTRGVFSRAEAPGRSEPDHIPAHEVAAAIGLASMIPVMLVLTSVTTRYYMDRYGIGAAMGLAILAGFTAPLFGKTRNHAAAVAALCGVLMLADIVGEPAWRMLLHGAVPSRAASASAGSLLHRATGRDPIVIPSALEYLQAWQYAAPELRLRLRYLADPNFAVREPDFLPELSLVAARQYLPCKIDDFSQFVFSHHRFYVYAVGMPRIEWTIPRLTSAGWSLRPLARQDHFTLFLAESPL